MSRSVDNLIDIDGSSKADMSRDFRLSKSKIMAGVQCHRRLWLETHRRDLARVSPASEHIFRMGHLFGERARPLMGQGELIGHVLDVGKAIAETRVALKQASDRGSMVYEAAFSHRNVVARADGFAPYAGGWHMTEVKAANAVKDYFYQDCAIQAWVAEGAGYPVHKVTLACIESRFVYPGGGDYDGLLRCIDVTAEVGRRKAAVDGIVEDLRLMLSSDEPQISAGSHCSSPYACPFMAHCGAHNASARGVGRRSAHHATVGSPPALAYPRHFLWLEAIASPVPLWTGTRPYQRIPVQWSCLTETQPGTFIHRAFLDSFDALSKHDFAGTLIDALGPDGAVIVATSAERAGLNALCESVPERRVELKALMRCLVYPTPGARMAHDVADAARCIEVTNSESAQRAWWEAASSATDRERRHRLADDLLCYGRQQTLSLHEAFSAHGARPSTD